MGEVVSFMTTFFREVVLEMGRNARVVPMPQIHLSQLRAGGGFAGALSMLLARTCWCSRDLTSAPNLESGNSS
jgi:hypothetical protein